MTLLSNIVWDLAAIRHLPFLRGAFAPISGVVAQQCQKRKLAMSKPEKPPETVKPAPAPPPAPPPEKEVGGRGGPDPVRYGDWEKGGIAVDF
jgi:hypothetical protein